MAWYPAQCLFVRIPSSTSNVLNFYRKDLILAQMQKTAPTNFGVSGQVTKSQPIGHDLDV
ncbi:hypothetical protein RRF57_013062 [Xylaria bambusicola]|uniref:Uncharacterized protein n=1 Tax=Xylaria bambusicola TaxID=326684 RepID=A0AAN7UQZ7_9PEZI